MQERALHMSVFVNIFRFHMWLYLYNCLQHMYNRLSVACSGLCHAHLTELIKVWMTDGKWEILVFPKVEFPIPANIRLTKGNTDQSAACDPS